MRGGRVTDKERECEISTAAEASIGANSLLDIRI